MALSKPSLAKPSLAKIQAFAEGATGSKPGTGTVTPMAARKATPTGQKSGLVPAGWARPTGGQNGRAAGATDHGLVRPRGRTSHAGGGHGESPGGHRSHVACIRGDNGPAVTMGRRRSVSSGAPNLLLRLSAWGRSPTFGAALPPTVHGHVADHRGSAGLPHTSWLNGHSVHHRLTYRLR